MGYQLIKEAEKNTDKAFLSARQKIRNEKNKIIFSSNNDELNRKILEKEKINTLLINQSQRKDKTKQRDSGLNQVLSKIAKKQNISIGINLDEIIESEKSNQSEIIARISQNIKLCNKNKINMKFVSEKYKKDIYDLKSLGLILGMPTWMTKKLEIINP